MIRNKPEDLMPMDTKLNGIYRGVVEDRNDPEKAGRVKVRVFGVHSERREKSNIEGIPTDELPWAEPAMGLIEGSISGFGLWSVPLQGSHVFVFFEAGHIMQPRYFATVPGIPSTGSTIETASYLGFVDPDNEYPNVVSDAPLKPNALNEPDFHRLARGEITSTIVNEKKDRQIVDIPTAIEGDEGTVTWNEPLPTYDAQYPENIVLATHGGIIVEIDNTVIPPPNENETEEGKRRVHIYHPSHTYIEITEDGDVIVRNNRDSFEIVPRNKKIYIQANEDKTIDQIQSLYVKKDREIKVDRHETKTIAKDLNVEVGNEQNETVAADKTVSVDGDEVHDVGGKFEETIGGDWDVAVGGNVRITISGTADIQAGGTVNVTAPSINLN